MLKEIDRQLRPQKNLILSTREKKKKKRKKKRKKKNKKEKKKETKKVLALYTYSTMTPQHATRDATTQQQGWSSDLVSPWRLDPTRGSQQPYHQHVFLFQLASIEETDYVKTGDWHDVHTRDALRKDTAKT